MEVAEANEHFSLSKKSRKVSCNNQQLKRFLYLNNFSPNCDIFKWSLSEASNNCICNVTNSRLKWEKLLWQSPKVDLVLEEVKKISGDLFRYFIAGSVGSG